MKLMCLQLADDSEAEKIALFCIQFSNSNIVKWFFHSTHTVTGQSWQGGTAVDHELVLASISSPFMITRQWLWTAMTCTDNFTYTCTCCTP